MPKMGKLRIRGHGDVEVRLVANFLNDLEVAYNSIYVFDGIMDRRRRLFRDLPFEFFPSVFDFDLRLIAPNGPQNAGLDNDRFYASLVPRKERLILDRVQLTSPGFWEVLGNLNPLEVLRQYLNDRHERRKDREYRESAEQRRLELDNLSAENRVIAERVRLAKELGASDRDLARILNRLVYDPLTRLDRHQDRHQIEDAEILDLSDLDEKGR